MLFRSRVLVDILKHIELMVVGIAVVGGIVDIPLVVKVMYLGSKRAKAEHDASLPRGPTDKPP